MYMNTGLFFFSPQVTGAMILAGMMCEVFRMLTMKLKINSRTDSQHKFYSFIRLKLQKKSK